MTRANDCTCDDEIDEDLTVDANGDGASDCADTDCYNVVYDALTGAYCPEGGGSEPIPSSSSSGCGCYLGGVYPERSRRAGQVGNLWILAGLAAVVGIVRRGLANVPKGTRE